MSSMATLGLVSVGGTALTVLAQASGTETGQVMGIATGLGTLAGLFFLLKRESDMRKDEQKAREEERAKVQAALDKRDEKLTEALESHAASQAQTAMALEKMAGVADRCLDVMTDPRAQNRRVG